MVHKELKKADGSVEEENRYYICSISGNVEELERAARGHWGGRERSALASGFHGVKREFTHKIKAFLHKEKTAPEGVWYK